MVEGGGEKGRQILGGIEMYCRRQATGDEYK